MSSAAGNPQVAGFPEHLEDLRGDGCGKHPGGHRNPRVVIEEVHDLDPGVIGDAPMGNVGLPAFVRQLGLESDPGAPRALVGLGHHEPPTAKHPPDRRDRRHLIVAKAQVVVDRLGPGIQALIGQGLAQLDDLVLKPVGRAVRDPPCGPRSGCDRFIPSSPEPADDLADPALGDPISPAHVPVAPPLQHDRVHHVASSRCRMDESRWRPSWWHREPMIRASGQPQ